MVCALLNQKEDGIEQPFDKMARLFMGLAATLFCCLIATLLTFIIIAAVCGFTMPQTTLYLFMADATCFAIGLFMAFIRMEIERHEDLDENNRDKL
jgi:cobalamin biosynthesis protein CobD/CbiB